MKLSRSIFEALGNIGESERSRTLKEHGVDVKIVDADEDMGEGDVHRLTERPPTFHWMQRPARHKVRRFYCPQNQSRGYKANGYRSGYD